VEFEGIFESIEGIIQSMISSSLRPALLNTSDDFNVRARNINTIQNELTRLRPIGKHIEQYFVYSENGGIVIGSQTVLSSYLYHKTFFGNSSLTYYEWLTMITTDTRGSFAVFEVDGIQRYAYVSRVPFDFIFGNQLVSMVFLISDDYISEINNQLSTASGTRLLLTVSGTDTINFSSDQELDNISPDVIYGESERTVRINNSRYFILNSPQPARRTYTFAIPYAYFFGELFNLLIIQFVIIALLTLLTVILSFFFSKTHYTPVVSILGIIKKYNKNLTGGDQDEYGTIKSNILNILSSYEVLSEKLETQSTSLRSHFLTRYLKGDTISEYYSLQDAFSNYEIDFNKDKYAVLIFSITDFEGFSLPEENDSDYKLCKLVLDNIISELISEKYYCVTHELNDHLVCIVNFDISVSQAQEELVEIFEKSSNFIAENFNIYFDMTAGNIKSNPNDIPAAYNEAISVLERNIVFGENNIFPINDKTSYTDNFANHSRKITTVIKAGDFDETNSDVINFFNIVAMYSAASPNLLRYELLGFIDLLLKEISTMGIDAEKFTENIAGKYQIGKFQNFTDIKQALIDMFKEISVFAGSSSGNIEGSVMDYIRKNYQDPNLSVSNIAEYYKLNPSYLSALIKESSKYGILESIHKIRCAHAAELLKTTAQNVQNISAAVGYTSVHTFIRVFKKYYGCTPSQFR
jgi:AraC-like DNA-binding protein